MKGERENYITVPPQPAEANLAVLNPLTFSANFKQIQFQTRQVLDLI